MTTSPRGEPASSRGVYRKQKRPDYFIRPIDDTQPFNGSDSPGEPERSTLAYIILYTN